MKRVLFVISLLLFAITLAQDAPEPVYGGEAVVSIAAEPPGWDPSASTSQEIARVTYHNVFEGLVRIDRDGEIVPALAESWELSDDGLTWTFTLRDGVMFHDGTPFTAEDVVAKFERAMDPESGHTHPEYYENLESVTAEGNTVTFTLSEPSSSLLYNLARPDSIIYPAGTAESQRSQPVGTGPFQICRVGAGERGAFGAFRGLLSRGRALLRRGDISDYRRPQRAVGGFASGRHRHDRGGAES